MKDIHNHITSKLFSGKYFLTVCCGVAFLYAVYAKILNEATIGVIIFGVFKDYFNINKDKPDA